MLGSRSGSRGVVQEGGVVQEVGVVQHCGSSTALWELHRIM